MEMLMVSAVPKILCNRKCGVGFLYVRQSGCGTGIAIHSYLSV